MKIIEYPDRDALITNVASVLAGALKNALLVQDRVSMAVPGGTTPGPIFDILSDTHLDWARVHIMLTDERWVPQDHPMSNTQLIHDRLITNRASDAHFVPFYQDGLTAEPGCTATAETLQPHMPLSILMLGMGADMHTASLFPGATGLEAAMADNAPLLCPIKAADQDIERVTLPAHALKGALNKHLVIFGDEKRTALDRATNLPAMEAPIGVALSGTEIHWAP